MIDLLCALAREHGYGITSVSMFSDTNCGLRVTHEFQSPNISASGLVWTPIYEKGGKS
jgi:hypothetical protein